MNPLLVTVLFCLCASLSNGFVLVAPSAQRQPVAYTTTQNTARFPAAASLTSLNMVDQQILLGGGIAVAGLAAGIALVAFTETQGERAKERGSGLSEGMATRITGQLMEDVEVSSVEDLGSLTSQLEKALKATSGAKDEEFEMTEEEKKRIAAEADDGW